MPSVINVWAQKSSPNTYCTAARDTLGTYANGIGFAALLLVLEMYARLVSDTHRQVKAYMPPTIGRRHFSWYNDARLLWCLHGYGKSGSAIENLSKVVHRRIIHASSAFVKKWLCQ